MALTVQETSEAFGPREATPEDIFGTAVPATIWAFRPSGANHGGKHPDGDSVYIDVECVSDYTHFGSLHGYVDPALFVHLMRVLGVEMPQ